MQVEEREKAPALRSKLRARAYALDASTCVLSSAARRRLGGGFVQLHPAATSSRCSTQKLLAAEKFAAKKAGKGRERSGRRCASHGVLTMIACLFALESRQQKEPR